MSVEVGEDTEYKYDCHFILCNCLKAQDEKGNYIKDKEGNFIYDNKPSLEDCIPNCSSLEKIKKIEMVI